MCPNARVLAFAIADNLHRTPAVCLTPLSCCCHRPGLAQSLATKSKGRMEEPPEEQPAPPRPLPTSPLLGHPRYEQVRGPSAVRQRPPVTLTLGDSPLPPHGRQVKFIARGAYGFVLLVRAGASCWAPTCHAPAGAGLLHRPGVLAVRLTCPGSQPGAAADCGQQGGPPLGRAPPRCACGALPPSWPQALVTHTHSPQRAVRGSSAAGARPRDQLPSGAQVHREGGPGACLLRARGCSRQRGGPPGGGAAACSLRAAPRRWPWPARTTVTMSLGLTPPADNEM